MDNQPFNQSPQTPHTPHTPSPTPSSGFPRSVWLFGVGMMIAGAGLAAVLMMKRPAMDPEAAHSAQLQPVAQQPVAQQPVAPAAQQPRRVAEVRPESRPAPVARSCANCGVVESVNAVSVKGEGSGAGAAIGGVLGGVVGNQMGGGSGKTAMTVLGAIGGGVAGNEVEKRQKSRTVYNVRVRMDDGTARTVTLAQAGVMRGDRVAVEGDNLRRV